MSEQKKKAYKLKFEATKAARKRKLEEETQGNIMVEAVYQAIADQSVETMYSDHVERDGQVASMTNEQVKRAIYEQVESMSNGQLDATVNNQATFESSLLSSDALSQSNLTALDHMEPPSIEEFVEDSVVV